MERIIFDCDPGHDDAVALALLKGLDSKIKTEMVIATHGNTSLDKTLVNALNLVQALNLDTKVYSGSSEPLVRNPVAAGRIHGENGLEGTVFPHCRLKSCGNGIRAAVDLVLSNPGQISFLSTGPWTDLAICIKSEPLFASNLKRIVVMGGSMGFGNVTPSAEFNVYADPEAAEIVFNCGVPVWQFGLDVTTKIMMDTGRFNKALSVIGASQRENFKASIECYTRACMKYGHDWPCMHDPCTVAYIADPEIFTFEKRDVNVDCKSEIEYGRTCASWVKEDGRVFVALDADIEAFWNLVYGALANL